MPRVTPGRPHCDGYADTLLVGGQVLTLDRRGTVASALAVRRGRIAAVCDDGVVRDLAGPRTRVVELGGRTVIPGIVDAHAHMEREGLKRIRPSVSHARSIPELLEVIAAQAARRSPGEWIVTMPVGQPPHYLGGPHNLAEGRMPVRHELDCAAPEHPVCISAPFGHWGEPPSYTALNSLALQRCGIDSSTRPACSGVDIERSAATDEPTGVIVEYNGRPTVGFDLLRAVPSFTFRERVQGLRDSLAPYHTTGTTSVYEGHGSSPESIAVYRELHERGELTMRTSLCVSPTWVSPKDSEPAMRNWMAPFRGRGIGDAWLRVSGVYVGLGGDPAVVPLVHEALPDTGWTGFVEWANSIDDFRAYAWQAARHDLRLHTVVRDNLPEILDILADVDRVYPLNGRRWVLEHVRMVESERIPLIARLGLVIESIPYLTLWFRGARFLDTPDGGESFVPLRTLARAGVTVTCGSDNVPPSPFHALWSIVAREERTTGRVIGPGQRLDRITALRTMTSAAAYLSFEEHEKGTLEIGKLADLAVLSADYRTIPAEKIRDITSEFTMVGGKIVYDALGW